MNTKRINLDGREINLQSHLDKMKNHLICLMCKNLPVKPKLILTCSHNFCDVCIAQNNTCPICNSCFTAEELLDNFWVENMIKSIFQVEDILDEGNNTNLKDGSKSIEEKTGAILEKPKTAESRTPNKTSVTTNNTKGKTKKENKVLYSPKAKSVILKLDKPTTVRKRSGSVSSKKFEETETKDQKKEETIRTKECPGIIDLPNGLQNIPHPEYIWVLSKKLKEISKKKNTVGETLLHRACIKGNVDVTKKYVEDFMNVNITDNYNWTPLHEAVKHRQTEIIEILLKAGAIVNVPSKTYETPLHLAVIEENPSPNIAVLLLKYGASANARTLEGYTPLDLANQEFKAIIRNTHQTISVPPILTVGMNVEAVSETIKTNKQINYEQFSIKVSKRLQQNTSFLLVSEEKLVSWISYMFLYAILKGFWIVNEKWYDECNQSIKFTDPSKYEIIGTAEYPDSYTPKRARLCRLLLAPGLFDGCYFYIYGNRYVKGKFMLTRPEIENLITAGSGKILKRCPTPDFILQKKIHPYHASGRLVTCTHYIIYTGQPYKPEYRFPEIHTLPVSWLLDCIQRFRLDFDPEKFQS